MSSLPLAEVPGHTGGKKQACDLFFQLMHAKIKQNAHSKGKLLDFRVH